MMGKALYLRRCSKRPHFLSHLLYVFFSTRSLLAISNDGGLHGAEVVMFNTFKVEDGVAERRWISMSRRGGGEVIAIASTRVSTARIADTISCSLGTRDGRALKDIGNPRGRAC